LVASDLPATVPSGEVGAVERIRRTDDGAALDDEPGDLPVRAEGDVSLAHRFTDPTEPSRPEHREIVGVRDPPVSSEAEPGVPSVRRGEEVGLGETVASLPYRGLRGDVRDRTVRPVFEVGAPDTGLGTLLSITVVVGPVVDDEHVDPGVVASAL